MRPTFFALLLIPLGACAQMPEDTSPTEMTTTASVPDPTTRKAASATESTAASVTTVSAEVHISETTPVVNDVASTPPVPYEEQATFIVAKIRQHFPGDDMMLCIANEESTGYIHWLPDGSLRPTEIKKEDGSIASSARGVLQTLAVLHAEDIARLNVDLNNVDDYFRFNRYLLHRSGYETWETYEKCLKKGYQGVSVMASN